MTKADVLTILKGNLGIITNDATELAKLNHLIDAAIAYMEREGVTFTETDGVYAFTIEDADLVNMYAAYLFRKRATDEGMPRMLRWALNNRIMHEKATAPDAT